MDQAQGIRQMKSQHPVRVIAITSGKGGVGKSNVTVNLAVTLAQAGEKVMVMDADMGLANIDVLLGLSPGMNLSHVINGECSLEETIIEGPSGIKIVPASSGVAAMSDLTPAQNAGVIRSFSELTEPVDTLAGRYRGRSFRQRRQLYRAPRARSSSWFATSRLRSPTPTP